MKRLIKGLFLLLTLVFSFSLISCKEKNYNLSTPTIEISNTVVSWASVENATSYDIYINDDLKDNTSSLAIDVSSYITKNGEYRICIIAKADGYTNSSVSNVVTYSKTNGTSTTEYTVSYIVNGSSYGKTKTVKVGNSVTLLTLTQNGYEFDGWYLNSDCTGEKYTKYTSNEAKEYTFYAKFINVWELEDAIIPTIIDRINNIGEVTINNKDEVISLYNEYISMTVRSQDLVTNNSLLLDYYDEACDESTLKVKNVEYLINLIGSVDSSKATLIKDARSAYDYLSKSEQLEVKNTLVLVDAENKITALSSNTYEGVICKIKSLPYSINKEYSNEVNEIISAYNNLSNTDKDKVYNYEFVSNWQNTLNKENNYILPLTYYSNVDELFDSFFGEFYKYILELYGKTNMVTLGYNSSSEFIDACKNKNINSEVAKYLFNNNSNGTIDDITSNYFIGYMNVYGNYSELFKVLYVNYSGYLKVSYGDFLCDNEESLTYIIDSLSGTYSIDIPNLVNVDASGVTGSYISFNKWIDKSYNLADISLNLDKIGELQASYINSLMNSFNNSNADRCVEKFNKVNELFESLDLELQATVSNYISYVEVEYKEIYKEELATTDKQGVLVATAKAFLMQNTQIEYDQYNSRRWVNSTPESATKDLTLILDCSSFAQSAMNFALDTTVLSPEYCSKNSLSDSANAKTAKMMAYAKSEGSNVDVIMQFSTSSYTTEAERQQKIEEIKSIVEPGDMFVYIKSNGAGHVMIYDGEGNIIHSTGTAKTMSASVNPETYAEARTLLETSQGSVVSQPCETFVYTNADPEATRYIFADDHESFAILRPAIRSDATITSDGLARYASPNLNVEKSVSAGYLHTVQLGEEITYTVTVKNEDTENASKFVFIKETLPSYVEYVSSTNGGVYSNGTIVWSTESIRKGATYEVSYTVRVKSNTSYIGADIIDSNTYVNNIKCNSLTNTIAKSDYTGTITENALSLVGSSYSDSLEFIQAAYELCGATIYPVSKGSYSDKAGALLSKVLATNTPNTSGIYYKSLCAFGGFSTNSASLNGVTKVRLAQKSMCEEGSIIVVKNAYKSSYCAYLYLNDSTILSVSNGTVVKSCSTESEVDTFFSRLYAYCYFVVLNPNVLY